MTIDELSVAAIRSTCIDVINKAKSGHPGMALGSAPILYTLFKNHLVSDSENPDWINRDRFILSAGHASALLYTMLHLCGYGLTIDDLKQFRQLNSLTPGHPEYGHTLGVDATSGPLGQGIAQAVGVAMAEQALQGLYEDGEKIINHYTYCLCGDGCLQEGLSQEAISYAGHQKLNKLILFYDSNNVTLDGSLDMSFSEDVKTRFIASGWNVLEVSDGNDLKQIDEAISKAKKSKDKPTLIIVKTIIGFGSLKQGTSKVHGSPLGQEDGAHAKKEVYHYDYEDFFIPKEVYDNFKNNFNKRGKKAYQAWQEDFKNYAKNHKKEALRFENLINNDVSAYLSDAMPDVEVGSQISTRNASGKALNDYILSIPNLIGGSADVAGSVITKINGGTDFTPSNRHGHNINWGIREFLMASAANGIMLHHGLRVYVGCFLVFADYMKSAIRMAALSNLPVIYLFSHDSIAVGEDGPTHQPIEQLAMLRSIPNLNVIRPCDEKETYAAWYLALKSLDRPTAIILSRQNLLNLEKTCLDGVKKGAYTILDNKENDIELIATGSEVSLALDVANTLLDYNIKAKVVSMPCFELFEDQDKQYQDEILSLPYEKRFSIEMLSTFGWAKYAKHNIGIDSFGTSAPANDAIKYFKFTKEDIVNKILKLLNK